MTTNHESEVIAQQLNSLGRKVERLEERMAELDTVTERLEGAAVTTARALQQVSHHWDAVYEAMRRDERAESRKQLKQGDDTRAVRAAAWGTSPRIPRAGRDVRRKRAHMLGRSR